MDTLPSVAGGRGFGASGDERKTRACIATTPALTGRGPSRDTVRSTGRGSPADRLLETKRIADEDPHERFRPLWGGARLDVPGARVTQGASPLVLLSHHCQAPRRDPVGRVRHPTDRPAPRHRAWRLRETPPGSRSAGQVLRRSGKAPSFRRWRTDRRARKDAATAVATYAQRRRIRRRSRYSPLPRVVPSTTRYDPVLGRLPDQDDASSPSPAPGSAVPATAKPPSFLAVRQPGRYIWNTTLCSTLPTEAERSWPARAPNVPQRRSPGATPPRIPAAVCPRANLTARGVLHGAATVAADQNAWRSKAAATPIAVQGRLRSRSCQSLIRG